MHLQRLAGIIGIASALVLVPKLSLATPGPGSTATPSSSPSPTASPAPSAKPNATPGAGCGSDGFSSQGTNPTGISSIYACNGTTPLASTPNVVFLSHNQTKSAFIQFTVPGAVASCQSSGVTIAPTGTSSTLSTNYAPTAKTIDPVTVSCAVGATAISYQFYVVDLSGFGFEFTTTAVPGAPPVLQATLLHTQGQQITASLTGGSTVVLAFQPPSASVQSASASLTGTISIALPQGTGTSQAPSITGALSLNFYPALSTTAIAAVPLAFNALAGQMPSVNVDLGLFSIALENATLTGKGLNLDLSMDKIFGTSAGLHKAPISVTSLEHGLASLCPVSPFSQTIPQNGVVGGTFQILCDTSPGASCSNLQITLQAPTFSLSSSSFSLPSARYCASTGAVAFLDTPPVQGNVTLGPLYKASFTNGTVSFDKTTKALSVTTDASMSILSSSTSPSAFACSGETNTEISFLHMSLQIEPALVIQTPGTVKGPGCLQFAGVTLRSLSTCPSSNSIVTIDQTSAKICGALQLPSFLATSQPRISLQHVDLKNQNFDPLTAINETQENPTNRPIPLSWTLTANGQRNSTFSICGNASQTPTSQFASLNSQANTNSYCPLDLRMGFVRAKIDSLYFDDSSDPASTPLQFSASGTVDLSAPLSGSGNFQAAFNQDGFFGALDFSGSTASSPSVTVASQKFSLTSAGLVITDKVRRFSAAGNLALSEPPGSVIYFKEVSVAQHRLDSCPAQGSCWHTDLPKVTVDQAPTYASVAFGIIKWLVTIIGTAHVIK